MLPVVVLLVLVPFLPSLFALLARDRKQGHKRVIGHRRKRRRRYATRMKRRANKEKEKRKY